MMLMICAYCRQNEARKEHLISNGILDLFPECFAAVDSIRAI